MTCSPTDDSFYSPSEQKARRKARRANMSVDEKCAEFFSILATLCTFLFGAWGTSSFANFLEAYIGFFADILGLVLYILVCCGTFILPAEINRKKVERLTQELEQGRALVRPIARAYVECTQDERVFLDAIVKKYSSETL